MILGASFDSVAANKAFADKFSFPFKLLSDVDRKLGMAYGASDGPSDKTARRISYLISPHGKITAVWGKESKIDCKFLRITGIEIVIRFGMCLLDIRI